MHTPDAQPKAQSLDDDDPIREAVLRAATEPLNEVLGNRAQVAVVRLNRLGSWVFLEGTMRGADGGRPDFTGTVYASRRADGVISDVYAALLSKGTGAGAEHDPRSWQLVDYTIGPTDVAWLTWPTRHGAPSPLFGL